MMTAKFVGPEEWLLEWQKFVMDCTLLMLRSIENELPMWETMKHEIEKKPNPSD